MQYPSWEKMSEEEKLTFIHEWCINLSNALNAMADRLSAVEAAIRQHNKENH